MSKIIAPLATDALTPSIRTWINLCEQEDAMPWQEALDEVETPADVARILQAAGARKIMFPGSTADPIYRLDDQVIEWDGKDIYAEVENVHQWVSIARISDYYPDYYEEQWNTEFWEHPSTLYHATTEDNVASILKYGLNPSNQTRGISNRSVGAAVFTTRNYDETEGGSYGDFVFEIDTHALATDPKRPYVTQEPDIMEYDLRGSLAKRLGIEDYDSDVEGGMSPDTVILYGSVPPQYLTQMD